MNPYDNAYEKLNEMEIKKENVDLDEFDEFMKKVEEVNQMVHALTSGNKIEIEEATKKADSWIENESKTKSKSRRSETGLKEEIINSPSVGKLKNVDKTIINKKESAKDENLDNLNSEAMSQEAFMKGVEADAKKRSEDRKKRIKESDALKLEANKAFRDKDYEKALDLYNKAIGVRRDSCVLYTNRALTSLNLGLYTRAITDCDWALKLNEKSLKARLYKGRAYFEMGEEEKSKEWMDETKEIFPDKLDTIEDYEKYWTKDEES